MKKSVDRLGIWGLVFAVVMLMNGPFGFAKKGEGGGVPSGFDKGEKKGWEGDRPPGWDQGEKKGWGDTGMPPGLAKKSGEAREKGKSKKGGKKKRG